MLFEEAIEVLHEFVAKERRNRADLGGREDAEQVSREGQPDLDLKLHHGLLVFGNESSFQRSHFNSEFSSKRAEPKLHVSVAGQNEVVRKLRRALKQRREGTAARRRSQGADLRDDFVLDR